MKGTVSAMVVHDSKVETLRHACFDTLIGEQGERPLSRLLARMLSSQQCALGAMPRWLGLSHKAFRELLKSHLPHLEMDEFSNYGEMLDPARYDEHQDLRELFLSHRTATVVDAPALAAILTAGCMGGDHLWQDMGFWSRQDLSAFIAHGFGPLAQKNIHDMKWKKFFYKQLCNQEGVYTCRAPSCQVCVDYRECFGPE
jgi:nitrogen fixation protein NifQ